ncbi:MAG: PD-(D/E)XK nuclease family protein [Myxococcales bacterium]|nr:PD-(D/E)XK nuclease family protein [Myxococcales bacterium]
MPSVTALRHAPWSLSKAKCALRCPQEFHFRYVEKIPELAVEPDARIGKAVHALLETLLKRKPLADALAAGRKGLLHAAEHTRFDELVPAAQAFVERIATFRSRRRVERELVEHRVAVDAALAPVPFFDKAAYFRGVWDLGYVFNEGEVAVVDHKTGARRAVSEFGDQLQAYGVLAVAHLRAARRVWLGVHFVAAESMEWSVPVPVEAVATELAPQLLEMLEEAGRAVAGPVAPKESSWCERCAYRSICPAMRARAAVADAPGGSG